MKIISLLLLFIAATGSSVQAQTMTYDDFKMVIPFLQKEDYKGAFEKTNELLRTTVNDSSDMRAIVTYMNIFSSAGMVSNDQMTHADFLKNANKYVGQRVVMSAHPCIDSASHGFNSLQFTSTDGQLQGITITANNKGTSILCFEYFKYAETIDQLELIGKNVRCGGILERVEVSAGNSKIWISRLHIKDAFARVSTPR